jgi:anti-sigma B factor antagonist
VLIGALKRVRTKDGDLRLVCSDQRVRKIFDITGLDKVFHIGDSVEESVA